MRIFLKVLKILGALLLLLLFPLILLLDWLLQKIPDSDETSGSYKSSDSSSQSQSEHETPKPEPHAQLVPDCFRILGMDTASCTAEEIKHQYRLMAMHAHPDVGGSEAAMKEINRAYEQAMTYCA
ncbi:J domain-containing protein [Ethanoligenens sp.]|uniref:J domain-containing protein n=1 Tax=Ethanoligenens sp. TaxID=2099655 RepID=UPI0039EA03B1